MQKLISFAFVFLLVLGISLPSQTTFASSFDKPKEQCMQLYKDTTYPSLAIDNYGNSLGDFCTCYANEFNSNSMKDEIKTKISEVADAVIKLKKDDAFSDEALSELISYKKNSKKESAESSLLDKNSIGYFDSFTFNIAWKMNSGAICDPSKKTELHKLCDSVVESNDDGYMQYLGVNIPKATHCACYSKLAEADSEEQQAAHANTLKRILDIHSKESKSVRLAISDIQQDIKKEENLELRSTLEHPLYRLSSPITQMRAPDGKCYQDVPKVSLERWKLVNLNKKCSIDKCPQSLVENTGPKNICLQLYAGVKDEIFEDNKYGATLDDFCGCYARDLDLLDVNQQKAFTDYSRLLIGLQSEFDLNAYEFEKLLQDAGKSRNSAYPMNKKTMNAYKKFARSIHDEVSKGAICEDSKKPVLYKSCDNIMASDEEQQQWLKEKGFSQDAFCSCYSRTAYQDAPDQIAMHETLLEDIFNQHKNTPMSVDAVIEKMFIDIEKELESKSMNDKLDKRSKALYKLVYTADEFERGGACYKRPY